MHALNRHMRRKLLSFTRRRKWAQLAEIIGVQKTLETAAYVRTLPNHRRKTIGLTV